MSNKLLKHWEFDNNRPEIPGAFHEIDQDHMVAKQQPSLTKMS